VFLKAEPVDVNHFLIMPTLNGESGFINNPAAYVIPDGKVTLGIHMEEFLFKANYGYKDFLEGGMNINFGISSNFLDIVRTLSLNCKALLLREDDYFISAAAGIEKLPMYLWNGDSWDTFSLYGVLSKKIMDMNFTAGLRKRTSRKYLSFMADASKVVNDTTLLMLEFDEDHFNAGLKISLNYNIDVEFYVKDLGGISKAGEIGTFLKDYFIFGITYLQ
jgi:hypothetical protein